MVLLQSQEYGVLEKKAKCKVEQDPQVEKEPPKHQDSIEMEPLKTKDSIEMEPLRNQDSVEIELPTPDNAPSTSATAKDPVAEDCILLKCFGIGNITSLLIGFICIVVSPFLDIDYHPELALIGFTVIVCTALTILFPRGCLSSVKYKQGIKPEPKSNPKSKLQPTPKLKPNPVSPTPTSSKSSSFLNAA